MSKQQVRVPDIGGAEGAEVIEVLVAAGDEVAVDQGLIVLESDKASMEIPSTVAGRVVEMLVSEGQQLKEGDPVAVVEVAGDAEATQGEQAAAAGREENDDTAGEGEPAGQAAAPQPAADTKSDNAAEPAAESGDSAATEQLVTVPDIGTEEAVELIEVLVAVGDRVAAGDSLVALESDKASMEVPSPAAGEIVELLVAAGTQVRQGDKLLVLRGEAPQQPASPAAAEPSSPPAERGSSAAAAAAEPSSPPAERAGNGAGAAAEAPAPQAAPAPEPDSGRKGVYAGPAVRKLAREFGVALDQVAGTGPRGRVLKEDVQEYVKQALTAKPRGVASGAGIPPIPEVDFARFGPVEVSQRSRLDKLTAANMQRSWLNVPHVTQFDEADITELEAFRNSLREEAERRGARLTPMPFLLKACAAALRENPKFNSSLAADGEQLVTKGYCHIGMAVDTPAGLMVPVIRDVDRKGIWELAEEVLQVSARARDRKLSPGDMQGACFTISSLGNIGGAGFTPIVNAPEVGILGVSKAAIKPVWNGSEFLPRNMLPLALSYDHRVINGVDGGRFLTRLVTLLGDIRQLLM